MPDLEATGALPPDDAPRDLEAELEAEFADHLALVARDEMLRGRSADEAQEKANERFGDVTQIERQCRWVHQGDAVMLRTVMIGGLVVLALALGYSTWTSRQGQADLRQQLAAVTAKLEAMAETQPAPTTGAISGVAYLGEKSKPAVGVEIQLLKAPPQEIGKRSGPGEQPDWTVERTVKTNEKGEFTFNVLSPATYAVLASLKTGDGTEDSRTGPALVQSVPTSLSPGENLEIPLDVEFRGGIVRMSLSHPLPGPFEVGEERAMLGILGRVTQSRSLPTNNTPRTSVPGDTIYRGYRLSGRHTHTQGLCILPGIGIMEGHPTFYSRGARAEQLKTHMSQLFGQQEVAEQGPTASLCVLDPFEGCNGDPRPWLEGSYAVELKLFLIDSEGGAYGVDRTLISGQLEGLLREHGVEVSSIQQLFTVADGKTTDLRVVPDNFEELKERLLVEIENLKMQLTSDEGRDSKASLRQLFSTDYSGRLSSKEQRASLDESRVKLAQALDHAFEIEVTGPHPAE